jgi:hypothetical protein
MEYPIMKIPVASVAADKIAQTRHIIEIISTFIFAFCISLSRAGYWVVTSFFSD